MKANGHSEWVKRMMKGLNNGDDIFQMRGFIIELENLDKAHKRAKRELRKQQKALEHRNNDLQAYKDWLDKTFKELNEVEQKYKHMLKACDAYNDENQELKYANEKLNRMLKNRDIYIEHLKKKIEKMQKGDVD